MYKKSVDVQTHVYKKSVDVQTHVYKKSVDVQTHVYDHSINFYLTYDKKARGHWSSVLLLEKNMHDANGIPRVAVGRVAHAVAVGGWSMDRVSVRVQRPDVSSFPFL